MPYLHRMSHDVKKVAKRHGVNIVFSAPRKLSGLCSRVEQGDKRKAQCTTRHATRYVPCTTGVVYQIPWTCGKVYIGQTGRCINDRTREHCASLNSSDGAHLATHCRDSRCTPMFEKIAILGRGRTKFEREFLEAYYIRTAGQQRCISVASLSLSDKEFSFLGG